VTWRLNVVAFFTTLAAVLISVSVSVAYQVVSTRAAMMRSVAAQADVVRDASAATLVFNDAPAARQILGALSAASDIDAAALYEDDGRLFAHYARSGSRRLPPMLDRPRRTRRDYTQWASNTLEAWRVVRLDDRPVGMLLLRAREPGLAEVVGRLAPGALLAIGISTLLVLTAVRIVAPQVTRPLLELTAATEAVAHKGDYRLRVPVRSSDEIGRLAHSFNTMLAQIRARDEMLERGRATLEQRVQQRTRELEEEASRRRQAQAEKEQALRERERIMEAVNDVIYALDPEGRITAFNRRMMEVTGRSAEGLYGLDALELFPLEDRRAIAEAIQRVLVQGEARVAGRLVHADGNTTWHEFTGRLLYDADGQIFGLTGVGRDIEDQRRAQAQVRALNAELEERVRERTAELEAANQELEAFSYSASHDLRTPLRSIDGFSRALAEEYADRLDDTACGYLDRIRRATDRMSELIDDLLRLSRVTRHDMLRAPVDLSALAQRIGARLRDAYPDHSVRFTVQPGMRVVGDAHLLELMLENLLGNAWKFTAKRPEPAVTFARTDTAAEPVWLVRDNGVGFDMRYATRLFRPFERLHSEREFPGTGIGLATVQRVVQRHGGRIWAEARENVGATFYFTLRADDGTTAA
jgi:PAS domain S-box-containing protein